MHSLQWWHFFARVDMKDSMTQTMRSTFTFTRTNENSPNDLIHIHHSSRLTFHNRALCSSAQGCTETRSQRETYLVAE